jgi:hypothetical protein
MCQEVLNVLNDVEKKWQCCREAETASMGGSRKGFGFGVTKRPRVDDTTRLTVGPNK